MHFQPLCNDQIDPCVGCGNQVSGSYFKSSFYALTKISFLPDVIDAC